MPNISNGDNSLRRDGLGSRRTSRWGADSESGGTTGVACRPRAPPGLVASSQIERDASLADQLVDQTTN